jgi:hypothetical protein
MREIKRKGSPPRTALRYDGRSFQQWKAELTTELMPERRAEAIRAFTAFAAHGYGKEATQAIVEVMRLYDVTTIRPDKPIGRLKQAAIDAFTPRTADRSDWDAIDPDDAVPVLVDELDHGTTNGRLFACRVLELLGTEAKPALDSLAWVVLTHNDARVRQSASVALAHADDQGKSIASVIRHLALKCDGRVLGAMLRNVPFVAHERSGLAYGGAGYGYEATGYGYGEAQPPSLLTEKSKIVLQALVQALDAEDDSVRRAVLPAIAQFGHAANQAAPRLLKLFDQADQRQDQVYIGGVLSVIGSQSEEVVPRLTKLYGQVEGPGRASVAQALGRFGPEAKESIPVLRKSLDDKSRPVRTAVRRALALISPDLYGFFEIYEDYDAAYEDDNTMGPGGRGGAPGGSMPGFGPPGLMNGGFDLGTGMGYGAGMDHEEHKYGAEEPSEPEGNPEASLPE